MDQNAGTTQEMTAVPVPALDVMSIVLVLISVVLVLIIGGPGP